MTKPMIIRNNTSGMRRLLNRLVNRWAAKMSKPTMAIISPVFPDDAPWLMVEAQPNGEGDNTYPEPRQLYVHYRSVFGDRKGYLRSDIVLEVSARSLLEPVAEVKIESLMSKHLPIKDVAPVPVVTATAGKTMVEKMFLLVCPVQ